MMKIVGPICSSALSKEWLDVGTLARTRNYSPADRASPPRTSQRTKAAALSAAEREVLAVLDAAEIGDAVERAMFLAQMAHETNGFRKLRENLRYTPKRLLEVFPRKFKDLRECEAVVEKGPDAIAERIYGGRKDLGNLNTGDGARYIGRGYVHLTGRANYAAASAALNIDLVNHPELAEQSNHAARIAVWFWNKNRIGPHARKGDVKTVTRIINGGTNGLEDRTRRFNRYREMFA